LILKLIPCASASSPVPPIPMTASKGVFLILPIQSRIPKHPFLSGSPV
jgi:hypothetical protein